MSNLKPVTPHTQALEHQGVAKSWESPLGWGLGAQVARFVRTQERLEQPPTKEHVLILTLNRFSATFEGPFRKKIAFTPDTVTLLPAGSQGTWQFHGSGVNLHLILPPKILTSLDPTARVRELSIPWELDFDDPQIRALLKTASIEAQSGYSTGLLFGDALVSAIVGRMLHRSRASLPEPVGSGLTPNQVTQVRNFVLDHLDQPVPIERIAQHFGYSPWHFQRLFRTATGEPIHRFVMGLRLKHARELLHRSPLSITEIAVHSGFSSPSHMAKHFRQEFGITPSDLRKESARPGVPEAP